MYQQPYRLPERSNFESPRAKARVIHLRYDGLLGFGDMFVHKNSSIVIAALNASSL